MLTGSVSMVTLIGVNTDWNWLLRIFALSTVSEYNLPSFLSGAVPLDSCFEFFRRENNFWKHMCLYEFQSLTGYVAQPVQRYL